MKKLTKEQITAIEASIAACLAAKNEVETLIEEYNEFINNWNERAQQVIDGYNKEVEELRDTYEQIAETAQEYYDERSETWQESDKGQAYAEWIGQLENPDIEEFDIDLPDPIEDPAFNDWENPEDWLPPSEPEK